MRLLHHFNQPDLALKLIKDESLDVFFGQVNAFLLAMNLLYRNNRYQDVLDVFDLIKSRECFVLKYPHDCVSQFMAAARKLVSDVRMFRKYNYLLSNCRTRPSRMNEPSSLSQTLERLEPQSKSEEHVSLLP